jgi:aspartyl-tRNA(Asn)/glutamyl-tRNA(Gln) amidotransferase subunit C
MSVTINDVEHIARLARLEFTPEEQKTFLRQFNDILAYMEQLNQLDTTNVEPLSHVIPLSNVVREDVVKAGLSREEALQNAPGRTDEFFTVPKVIGDTS